MAGKNKPVVCTTMENISFKHKRGNYYAMKNHEISLYIYFKNRTPVFYMMLVMWLYEKMQNYEYNKRSLFARNWCEKGHT